VGLCGRRDPGPVDHGPWSRTFGTDKVQPAAAICAAHRNIITPGQSAAATDTLGAAIESDPFGTTVANDADGTASAGGITAGSGFTSADAGIASCDDSAAGAAVGAHTHDAKHNDPEFECLAVAEQIVQPIPPAGDGPAADLLEPDVDQLSYSILFDALQ